VGTQHALDAALNAGNAAVASGQQLNPANRALTGITTVETGTVISFSVRASYALVDSNGNLVGAVVAGYDLSNANFLKEMQAMVDCEVGIFWGDTLFSSTLPAHESNLIINGSANAQIIQTVLQQGGIYTGQEDFLGASYQSSFAPLVSDNQTVGMLYCAANTTDTQNSLNALIGTIVGLGLVITLAVILGILRFMGGTVRVLNEQLVDARNRAEAESKSKTEYLSSMSHEIRTPLNAITGMTNLALSAPTIERKNYCLGRINEASEHMLGVINKILDIAKIEAGKLELNPVVFNFHHMLDKVANIMRFRLAEKGQHFALDVDSRFPERCP
jgi:signal transduction histidine kinase